ncbi:MAG TPA: hypothetical protein V6C81_04535 [Planktothrix sp.]|jgi:hypothetical protein
MTVAPALTALLIDFIDYAGVFPPASESVETAVKNYIAYKSSNHAWILKRFVIGEDKLTSIPESLDGSISLLSESDQQRAGAIESKGVVKSASHPVYCEVALNDLENQLDAIKSAGQFAKIRMGSVKPDGIPSSAEAAKFITACAKRRLAFKATAGLHHPVRATYPLTYEHDAPRAIMHGFINVLMASALSWHGKADAESVLEETDPSAFSFDSHARWRGFQLNVQEIAIARRDFIHSVGSCSFTEPVQELKQLGWLA